MKKINYKSFQKYIANAIIAICICLLGVLTYTGGSVGVFSSNNNMPIYFGNSQNNVVSLMFNVYQGNEHVEKILEILKSNNVKATFFVGGIWVEKNSSCFLKIYESVYGKIKRELPRPMKTPKAPKPYKEKPIATMQTYLLIDGYNIIFSSDELKEIAEDSFDAAREILIRRVCNYKAVRPYNIILVFDAYKVKGAKREIEEISGITVVYTKEAETADAYIEKTSKELAKNYRVRVATSDGLEQIIIFSQGAMRIPASEFLAEIELAENEIRDFIKEYNK